MIAKENFTKGYIENVRLKTKVDPTILERSIFAFGLVEALAKTGANFIFKGGTSLMLLLDKPMRLSTDIDILVQPNYDIEQYVEEASKIYPFISKEESVRNNVNGITKKHYKFYYKSLGDEKKTVPILLDVLFEENHYSSVIKKEIKTEFLKIEEPTTFVFVPSVNSILGDKLTAFAPNTCGIKYITQKGDDIVVDKKTEVIKQFFDVASLYDKADNFDELFNSYVKTAETEIKYRGLDITYKDCLKDTFSCALSIYSKGRIEAQQYDNLLEGIKKIKSFLMNVRFDGETAYKQASKVMLLCAGILTSTNVLKLKIEQEYEIPSKYNKINFMKKLDMESYKIVCFAINLMENNF